VGNLVRLNTGEKAVVLKIYAPDPHRPQVRVVIDRHGSRVNQPYDVNLWENSAEEAGVPATIVAPLDPAESDLDPLAFL
jgi:hypothetical protein